MAPGKCGTGRLRDLNGSILRRAHENGPELFQTARSFTMDRITQWINKITAGFVERHLLVGKKTTRKLKILEMHQPVAFLVRSVCWLLSKSLKEWKV